MKLLRDESGYVLVMPRPQVLAGAKAAERDLDAVQPIRAENAVARPVCSVPHCCFYCGWCGQPILLPNDRIGSPFGHPDARKIDVRSIATICNHCRHVGNYSMFRACRGFDTRHRIMHSPIKGQTVLLHWLQCVERTCPDRVPLFMNLDDDGRSSQEATGWLWEELTCASGHVIRQIPIDSSCQLPVRTPPSSR